MYAAAERFQGRLRFALKEVFGSLRLKEGFEGRLQLKEGFD